VAYVLKQLFQKGSNKFFMYGFLIGDNYAIGHGSSCPDDGIGAVSKRRKSKQRYIQG
jgi:hypothetical protein